MNHAEHTPPRLPQVPMAPLPQVVPSQACFQCDVCCRFPEPDSFLRPYFTSAEIRRALDAGLDPVSFPSPDGGQVRLVPHPTGDGYICPAFDPETSHCRIYEARPLDCQVYPLAVMWNQEHTRVMLGWDQKCPYLVQHAGRERGVRPPAWGSTSSPSQDLAEYSDRVAALLESDQVLDSLTEHPHFVGPYQEDVVVLRTLPRLTSRLVKARDALGVTSDGKESDPAPASVSPRSLPLAPHPLPLTSPSSPLTPLTLADRPLVERALASGRGTSESALAAYGFSPHMVWQPVFRLLHVKIENHLCLFAENTEGLFMVLPPLGPGPLSGPLKEAFSLMHARNPNRAVSRVENVPEELKDVFDSLGYRLSAKDPDYLYRASDLVGLTGDRYKSQRAACNRLEKTSKVQYEPYAKEQSESCLALLRLWVQQKKTAGLDELAEHLLEDTERAHRAALLHHEDMGLIGRILRVDGEIRGYTFGFRRSPTVFCVLLEVADRNIAGAAQVLFRESCREAVQRGYTFINTMDAFGLPRLAQSKSSYRPVALVRSYIATEP